MTWKGKENPGEETRGIYKVKVHKPASLGAAEGRIVLFKRHSI
jgi:hypothetical protein